MSRKTIATLMQMKMEGEKITMLTSYDASFTRVLEAAGVDSILVGDSLGMVVQGQESTLPVSVDEMVYHTRCVARGRHESLLIADMPFMSYGSAEQALSTASRLMKEGGAHMVKLEGGASQLETVRQLTMNGIPVCAHLGLQPQSVHKLGGYRVQGKDQESAREIKEDAMALEAAGAQMLVLECVPSVLAAEISRVLSIPVIGIGAGVDCDGQVLVVYDMLGITSGRKPRFVKDFMPGAGSVQAAVSAYVQAVKEKRFPTEEHSFQ
ncbi:MAG: 3-methyl-2-oxobutanoate hydroxymethyltransferase [Chromatiaceae bacterium]|nr:3-methyl-2-oxobutanoate hydroxymethyltransferase [Gammaproteobacteria bacterium]MCB1880717.1 3-methyl-2-oxobutanoate hydroxymethyltransferase [Gammaproteobacteria bacterium]MCP5428229.1 3-methyl-2-oxobutanoate hydroxymethyltransferase [Chromatiaceae bacterium]MCP5448749.1 3-methyl-2-oxobutanoate hydroxymethyltransferase [Chromatiaceae bacterium]